MARQEFIHLNDLFQSAYNFQNGNLFKEPFIELESVGARKKFWFRFQNHLFLYKKVAYSIYEAYGEILSQNIANVLDIPCAHYMLADFDYQNDTIDDFKDSSGVITINFLKNGERLVPVGEIISQVLHSDIFPNEEKQKLYGIYQVDKDVAVHKMNNLEDLWPILDLYFSNHQNKDIIVYTIMDYLVRVYFFDLITLQGDRHIWNFGVIIDKENRVRPAPIFDNSNMCNLNRPKTILNFMGLMESPKRFLKDKKVKLQKNIYDALYHSKLRFSANSEDFLSNETVDKKAKPLDSLEQFLKKTESSYVDLLSSYISRIEDYTIERILLETEENIGVKFEEKFKNYVIQAMYMNLENIKAKIAEFGYGGMHGR